LRFTRGEENTLSIHSNYHEFTTKTEKHNTNMQSNYGFNKSVTEQAHLYLHTQFELTAQHYPDEIALVFAKEKITFKELNERADNLCHGILNWAYYEDIIGISATPCIEMVVGILAILKSGKAFVPIDLSAPEKRNKQIIQDAGLSFCVAKENEYESFQFSRLNLIYSDNDRQYPIISDKRIGKMAYLMYTSGSTCQPKGVKIEHKAILNYLQHAIQNYTEPFENEACSYLQLPITFDGALTSLFTPLLSGKKLVMATSNDENAFLDPNFRKYMPYDFLKLTPIQLGWLEQSMNDCVLPTCDKMVIGGEALHLRHLNFLKNKGLDLTIINEYGPTEATVGCMNYSFQIDDSNVPDSPHGIPVGGAIAGMEVCILDKQLQTVQANEIGEIYITGPQLSNGYMMRPELNEQQFVVISSDNALKTFYKTGDRAFFESDGTLYYIDRDDYKITINNKEVDLDLVEFELSKIEGIQQCKVVCKTIDNVFNIFAYIIPTPGKFDLEKIRLTLNNKLLSEYIPKELIVVNSWPSTASGKLNRHALPLPGCSNNHEQFRMPESETEIQIAEIWNRVLGHEAIDVHTGFFEMGGNHEKAFLFLELINKHFDHSLEMSQFYKCSSISCLAKAIEKFQLKNKKKENYFKPNKNAFNRSNLLN
jgi:amino acid adenylation domain-containing protein